MKRSLKVLVALFSLFIATAGICSNMHTEQGVAIQTTDECADASRNTGYHPDEKGHLLIVIREGVAEVIITRPSGSKEYREVVGFIELQVEAGSTYEIHGAYGFRISEIKQGSPYGIVEAGETVVVEMSLTEVYPQ